MKRSLRSPIDLFEEACQVLRGASARTWIDYYTGALPFVLGLMFFWADMSSSAFAANHCAPAALGVAILYVWMQGWQSRFVRRLHTQLAGEPLEPLNSAASWRLIGLQAAIQPTKLVVLPIAALCLFPLAGVYAFYQNLMILESPETSTISSGFRAARKPALAWVRQNWALLAILLLMNAIVFINVAALLLIVPYLLKLLLGIESVFTRSILAMFNTTFLAVAAGLTYLLTNPLAKAVYMLRHFYAVSIESGADLRLRFAVGYAAPALLLVLSITGSAQPPTSPPTSSVSTSQLNHAIDEVIHRPEFTWRMPRAAQPDEGGNWFLRTTGSILDAISTAVNRGGQAVKRVLDWLGDQLKSVTSVGSDSPAVNSRRLRALVFVMLIIAAAIAGWLLWRTLRSRTRRKIAVARAVVGAAAALASEDLLADQHPLDEWIQLARDAMSRQELRLALRAFYLAGLAYLAERSLISIQRGKSNQDYARELDRRARSTPEMSNLFNQNLQVFERSWYGLYDVDAALLERFQLNLDRMRTCAGG